MAADKAGRLDVGAVVAASAPHHWKTHPGFVSWTQLLWKHRHHADSQKQVPAMSSRALRKAQQRAEQERLSALEAAKAPAPPEPQDEDDDSEDEPAVSTTANLFSMLDLELEEAEAEAEADDNDEDEEGATRTPPNAHSTASTTKPKKKNKKKKAKSKAKELKNIKDPDSDFDSALEALNTASHTSTTTLQNPQTAAGSPEAQLQSLLRIEPRHLDLENEMRKLFGHATTARETAGTGGAHHDPRQPRAQRLPGGVGRRNVFAQRGDGWPREVGSGLSMELVERGSDGSVLFHYSHSRLYKDVQRQFSVCVQSMDPDRMFSHLHAHPYHVSTLLQASHIALTQTTDHTAAQAFVARALYALGRSAHSTFTTALAAGTARLTFQRFEDRELFFAGWKYVASLSRRGLWRTGLEFVRLLLQMDPLHDPLCLVLLVDQYALKSRAPEVLIGLAQTPLLKDAWSKNPNIAYSLSLAHFMAGNPDSAKVALVDAIQQFPWVMTKLQGSLQEGRGGSLPEGLWGRVPPSDADALLTELYVERMGDLWNIPENAAFLQDTMRGMGKVRLENKSGAGELYVGERLRDLARHVFLMDPREGRGLIGFLPRDMRENQGYAWDVLPPVGGESSYQTEMEESDRMAGAGDQSLNGAGIFEVFLRSLIPSFQAPTLLNRPHVQQQQPAVQNAPGDNTGEGTFEIGEGDLQATLIAMVEEGLGFSEDQPLEERVATLMRAGLVPLELQPWFAERYGPLPEGLQQEEDDEEQLPPPPPPPPPPEEQEDEREARRRDNRAVDRLVQILGTGDQATLRMRVDRMFEGQGDEMAEVRQRVEERLGLR
ncbi:hypothetical protein DRE_04911 [Drechslerella stenobrocha 248]|uniref:DUF654-domain-containing protein n=1 Tax=Drechslerella stenobrocha 248 TaxID=1043628 RepID=W7HRT0_9PEZI|nr:hypothetical protein DRE_04911 [Drechslerella stenobrocha 248]